MRWLTPFLFRAPRPVVMTAVLTMTLLVSAISAQAGPIEAIKGKRYGLSERHGPWMIVVASLSNRPHWDGKTEGMTAQEAADELVYYLRKRGIPAYTFSQKTVPQEIETLDRRGRQERRWIFAQKGNVSVLAGNYDRANDKIAQETLDYIKDLEPKFLTDRDQGANFQPSEGQPTPLSGAFLTINPLLSPEQARARQRDPLVAQLNAGQEHSLLNNPGKYSMVVASFYGKSLTVAGDDPTRERNFEIGENLDAAAKDAWVVCKLLRNQNYEAFVYHDRHRSVVTVGSFDNPRDARITDLARKFGAKVKNHQGNQVLTAEALTLPGRRPNDPPQRTFILDPSPQLIDVPRWNEVSK